MEQNLAGVRIVQIRQKRHRAQALRAGNVFLSERRKAPCRALYNYALSDSYARFKKMQGFNVFEPMGFDSFGLPAENYAIKTGIHPQDSTLKNIEIMEEQLKNMGAMFDWDAEVKTCMPDYYKWTQWCF